MPEPTKSEAYIVVGCTGEYSDRTEWLVRGFYDAGEAENFVYKVSRKAREWESTRKSEFDNPPAGFTDLDPNMRMDYMGTNYRVETVEMEKNDAKTK